MNVSVPQLRALVAVVDEGTFTDAAIALGVSQASVSRAIQGLEKATGAVVVQRTTRSVELTADGRRILDQARRILDELDYLDKGLRSQRTEFRVGYAWSALGRHTTALQRQWATNHPEVSLLLVQSNTPTSGLAEGDVDAAFLRRPASDARFESVAVGTERRYAALASSDPLATRRTLGLADFAGRVVGVDRRTGTTTAELWDPGEAPTDFRDTHHVDDWMNLVAAGQVIGMTSHATVAQHPRPGVVFRLVRDASPITVFVAWKRSAPPFAGPDLVTSAQRLLSLD